MRRITGLFALLVAVPLLADVKQLVNEGIALHDQGRYDEAIAKYNAALAEDPSSDLAAYELAFAYHAKGDFAQCKTILEPRVKTKNPYRVEMHGILGNCYDMGGDPARAIETYRRGLKIDGNDTQLLYNLAVTLTVKGDYDEARKLLKKELAINPNHRSGHYALAQVFDAQNFRVPATLSYLRFLSVEPSGERAKAAASRAVTLLGAGVERKDEQNISITIDSNSRKEEGDFSATEMMMALAGATQSLPENENKSDFEKTLGHVITTLAMVVEGPDKKRNYTATQLVPFFRTLSDRKLLEAYAATAISSLGLAGGDEWRLAHADEIQAYMQFMSGAK